MSRLSVTLYGKSYNIRVSELPTYKGKQAYVDPIAQEIIVCDLGEHGLLKSLAAAVNDISDSQVTPADDQQPQEVLAPLTDRAAILPVVSVNRS